MAYNKIGWLNNKSPYINQTNLNKMDNGIYSNSAAIASLSMGETMKGEWKPSAGAEYPLTPKASDSYYIGELSSPYLFTGGDLSGETADNQDKILYTSDGWVLLEAQNIPTDIVKYVETTGDLSGVDINIYLSAIVREDGRGGVFNYDPLRSGENDDGIVFDGWVRQYDGRVQSSWFDMTDPSATLKYIFETFNYVLVDNLTYTIPTATSIIATLTKDIDIEVVGTVLSHSIKDNPLLKFVQGGYHLKVKGLEVSGNYVTSTGIWFDGSADVTECEIYNLSAELDSAVAIKCVLENQMSIVNISDNYIHDIDAKRGVPVNTGASGSAMGIYASIVTGGEYSNVTISNNNIQRCYGSEGTCVYVANDTDISLDSIALFTVRDNYLRDANRRMIKSQARTVHVKNNTIISLTDGDAAYNEPAAMLSLIAIGTGVCGNHIVDGNSFTNRSGTGVTIAIGDYQKAVSITNNRMDGIVIKNYIQVSTSLSGIVISDNIIEGAEQALLLLQGAGVYFKNNIVNAHGRKVIHCAMVATSSVLEVINNTITVYNSSYAFLGVVYFDNTQTLGGINTVRGNTLINTSSDTSFGLVAVHTVDNTTVLHAIDNIVYDHVTYLHGGGTLPNTIERINYSTLNKEMTAENG